MHKNQDTCLEQGVVEDDRWAQHIDMENYLMDKGGAELVHMDVSVETALPEAIAEQMAFVRKIPLWPFRGVIWYFTRRTKWHNLTIRDQHEKAMIRLRNEFN